jgi:hypothetical protein
MPAKNLPLCRTALLRAEPRNHRSGGRHAIASQHLPDGQERQSSPADQRHVAYPILMINLPYFSNPLIRKGGMTYNLPAPITVEEHWRLLTFLDTQCSQARLILTCCG